MHSPITSFLWKVRKQTSLTHCINSGDCATCIDPFTRSLSMQEMSSGLQYCSESMRPTSDFRSSSLRMCFTSSADSQRASDVQTNHRENSRSSVLTSGDLMDSYIRNLPSSRESGIDLASFNASFTLTKELSWTCFYQKTWSRSFSPLNFKQLCI